MSLSTQIPWSVDVVVTYAKYGKIYPNIYQSGVQINSFVFTTVNIPFYHKINNLAELELDIFVNFTLDGRIIKTKYEILHYFYIDEVERFCDTLYEMPSCSLCMNFSKFYSLVVLLTPTFPVEPIEALYDGIYQGNFFNELYLGQPILAVYSPFGSERMNNSIISGVVSNIHGENNDVFMTDCRFTNSFEGCPVLSESLKPIGMMISNILTPCDGCHIPSGLTFGVSLGTLFSTVNRDVFGFNSIERFGQPTYSNEIQTDVLAMVYFDNFFGSGIFIHRDGLVLTCAHVVNYRQGIEVVVTYGPNNFRGFVIFSPTANSALDMAIIQIIGNYSFPCANLSITPPRQGETVFSLGHMTCGDHSKMYTSKGVISKLLVSFFNTTCILHPGTSGGPVIRANGEVVGIITAGVVLGGYFPYCNYCISIYFLQPFLNDFLITKDVQYLMYATEVFDQANPNGCVNSKL